MIISGLFITLSLSSFIIVVTSNKIRLQKIRVHNTKHTQVSVSESEDKFFVSADEKLLQRIMDLYLT